MYILVFLNKWDFKRNMQNYTLNDYIFFFLTDKILVFTYNLAQRKKIEIFKLLNKYFLK
jgi:hypothetical protein